MTAHRGPRMLMPLRERRGASPENASMPERLLQGLGAHPSFSDAVLGDLAEERARRTEQHGRVAGQWWYVRETLRSAPHLLWNAIRHGGARGRARAAAVLVGVALLPTIAVIALVIRDGPPARLVIDAQHGFDASDGIVLNTRRPVQLAMRVFDAEGNALSPADVRYRWIGGTPLPVSPRGVVTCREAGDATVRASLGTVETTVLLRCRPVKTVHAEMAMSFFPGDPGKDLAFSATSADGRPVDLLAGELRVQDTSVATLRGTHVRPVAPGRTAVIVRIGDGESETGVSVYEPVRTLAGLRADQEMVVAPVRLARAETIRWPLPMGLFWLQYYRASTPQPLPVFAVDGLVMCMPDFGPTIDHVGCLVRAPGASIRITHPGSGATIVGSLALERHAQR